MLKGSYTTNWCEWKIKYKPIRYNTLFQRWMLLIQLMGKHNTKLQTIWFNANYNPRDNNQEPKQIQYFRLQYTSHNFINLNNASC